jgi:hypothetical protein
MSPGPRSGGAPILDRAKRQLHPLLGQVVVLLRDRTLEQQLHLPVVRVVADPRRPVVREHPRCSRR